MFTAVWMAWMASALAGSAVAVWLLARGSVWLGLIDRPNHRSLHNAPVPRGGGAGFVAVFASLVWPASQSLAIELSPPVWRVVFAGLLVATVGLADDRFGLPVLARLAAQVAAAAYVAAPWILGAVGNSPEYGNLPGVASPCLAIVAIVALTNFYNFMDGADGLAAGHAVITLTSACLIALRAGHEELTLAAGLLAASVAGFLIHNWRPARIFMGDVGSTFLGFLFGSLAATAVFEPGYPAVPAAAWLCLLAPFLADTTVTLVWRVWRGERWHQAHRQHYYQRLIRNGFSHSRVATLYLGVAALLGVIAVAHFALGAGSPMELLFSTFAVMAAAVWLTRRGVSRPQAPAARSAALGPSGLGHSVR